MNKVVLLIAILILTGCSNNEDSERIVELEQLVVSQDNEIVELKQSIIDSQSEIDEFTITLDAFEVNSLRENIATDNTDALLAS